MSTVWCLGGRYVNFQGHGYGTIDGNAQAWHDVVKGQSNYPVTRWQMQSLLLLILTSIDRPMALTIWDAKDPVFEVSDASGLRCGGSCNSEVHIMSISPPDVLGL